MSRLLALAAVITLAAPALADDSMVALDDYTPAEVQKVTKAMAKKLDMPIEDRIELIDRLESKLKKKAFKRWTRGRPIRGVFAYSLKEGGLVVKWTKGRGKAAFKGGPSDVDIAMKATSVGAQVGGSKQWGIGLVIGLKRLPAFGGQYKGNIRQATAISAGHVVTELRRADLDDEKDHHRVLLLAVATGLSASTGGTKLKITVDWP